MIHDLVCFEIWLQIQELMALSVIWVGIGYNRVLWTISDWAAKKAFLWSWCLSRILNRRIQPCKRLRIDSLEKELRKYKGPQDTYEQGMKDNSNATDGCNQSQWEEKEATGDKSDRSKGIRTYSQGCPICGPWATCSPGWLWMQPNIKS